jgi:hypothetical protein
MSFIPSSSNNLASILACSAMMRGTYVDVEGALRGPKKPKKLPKCCASDAGWTERGQRQKRINGRHGKDLCVSVIEISEFPDGQLFDGRRLGFRRCPEARYGSDLSGPYWGRGVTWRICGLHMRRNVGVGAGECVYAAG